MLSLISIFDIHACPLCERTKPLFLKRNINLLHQEGDANLGFNAVDCKREWTLIHIWHINLWKHDWVHFPSCTWWLTYKRTFRLKKELYQINERNICINLKLHGLKILKIIYLQSVILMMLWYSNSAIVSIMCIYCSSIRLGSRHWLSYI